MDHVKGPLNPLFQVDLEKFILTLKKEIWLNSILDKHPLRD